MKGTRAGKALLRPLKPLDRSVQCETKLAGRRTTHPYFFLQHVLQCKRTILFSTCIGSHLHMSLT